MNHLMQSDRTSQIENPIQFCMEQEQLYFCKVKLFSVLCMWNAISYYMKKSTFVIILENNFNFPQVTVFTHAIKVYKSDWITHL